MSENRLLKGDRPVAVRAVKGPVELFASRWIDGQLVGRPYHYQGVNEGESFVHCAPVQLEGATWVCFLRTEGEIEQLQAEDASFIEAGQATFRACVERIDETIRDDVKNVERRRSQAQDNVDRAFRRLGGVNRRISKLRAMDIRDSDELSRIGHVLCEYMKADFRMPSATSVAAKGNLLEEMLHLSGIRFKNIYLDEDWWKNDSGAILGVMRDGQHVVLLPHPVSGYTLYNPKVNETIRLTRNIAKEIRPQAMALYRTLKPGELGFTDILRFLFGEHIYKEAVIIVLFSLLAAMIQVLPPILSAQIFDVLIPERMYGMLVEVLLILLAFQLARVGFSVIINMAFMRINTKVDLSLTAALWDRILSFRVPFFSQYTTGELLRKIRAFDTVKGMLSIDYMEKVLSALFSFINIIVLFRYIPEITPHVLMMFLICVVISVALERERCRVNRRFSEGTDRAMSLNLQWMKGMYRIKASRSEDHVFGVWSENEAELRYLKSRIRIIDLTLEAFYAFYGIASVAIVYFMISRVTGLEVGVFIAYISTFMITQAALMNLLKAIHVVPDVIPALHSIRPILEKASEKNEKRIIPQPLDGSLEVNHVSFQYGESGRPVLRDISFRVEPGESIGILGASGCGKTTLLKLLFGFYMPANGKVYVGGYDISSVDVRYIRRQMGVVLQEARLTAGTIYENIVVDDHSLSEELVMKAIRMVGMEEDIRRLPYGLNTILEMNAVALSQGQKQRLLIARAIVKGQKYLLFDEATSSLDNETQSMIMDNIAALSATKIIVAQRLSTIQKCDRILILSDGEIHAQGTYEEIGKEYIIKQMGMEN